VIESRTDSGFPVVLEIADFHRAIPEDRVNPGEPEDVDFEVLTPRGQPAKFLKLTQSEIERFRRECLNSLPGPDNYDED